MNLWSYLEGGGLRAAACWHRRGGKDEVALHRTSVASFERAANYWHMLPQAEQSRKAIWEAVNAHSGRRRVDEAFPTEIRRRTRDNDMMIEFVNNSTWRVVGSDNYNSLVGSGPAGIVFSEWSLADPRCWPILAPMLEENGGWALFIFTSRGRNHGHSLVEMARKTPGWFCEVLPATSTPVFNAEQLARIEAEYESMFPGYGESLFRQEYLCDFEGAVFGSYYGKEMHKAEAEGRICELPYHRELPVYTGWDLGIGDDTSIWFVQRVGPWLHVIDHYAANGEPASHYADVLRERGYHYAEHFLPHDAEAREWGNGMTRLQTLRKAGINGEKGTGHLRVVDKQPVDDGINAVRLTLPICRFDRAKCKRGLESLRQYRREYDEERRTFRPTPLHDWTSHDADGFRSLACGMRPEAVVPPKPPAYRRNRGVVTAPGGSAWAA